MCEECGNIEKRSLVRCLGIVECAILLFHTLVSMSHDYLRYKNFEEKL